MVICWEDQEEIFRHANIHISTTYFLTSRNIFLFYQLDLATYFSALGKSPSCALKNMAYFIKMLLFLCFQVHGVPRIEEANVLANNVKMRTRRGASKPYINPHDLQQVLLTFFPSQKMERSDLCWGSMLFGMGPVPPLSSGRPVPQANFRGH